jgi:hypothetical protein
MDLFVVPTISFQLEAYGWTTAPRYVVRDCDAVHVFIRRLRMMGIRDRPTAVRSPWQNRCAERLIGSIRRECLDHVVVFGERHLQRRSAEAGIKDTNFSRLGRLLRARRERPRRRSAGRAAQ